MNNIVLFGFMGTGKTTVGKMLAKRLGLNFLDMDDLLVQEAEKSITEIFAQNGEPYFRAMERNMVQKLSKLENVVIATGGGVVLDWRNVDDFIRSDMLVCLMARQEVILQRVSSGNNRPLLEDSDKALKIKTILNKRKKLYETLPTAIDTSDLAPEQVVDQIVVKYKTEFLRS